MALSGGTRLGPYEILAAIGSGGMGEVYKARDSKLQRDVALKILPSAFAADPERHARFTREAQVLASLNHPHIAQIYGLEESGPVTALVMELVEGPTLADRISQGPISLDEALPIARQIAEALEAAHEQGIIHRDLKPANIKGTDDGTVKVLDFGLAKALDPAGSGVDAAGLTNSPTITSPAAMTQRGVILGTAAYMSPEQAKGRAVDKRADIWAFGCVLYEMLTGTRAFPGEDVTDTIVSVLGKEPAWDALPATTPSAIRRLLRRCLEKDRKRRLDSIADARLEIEDALAGSTEPQATAATLARSHRHERLAWSGVVAVLAIMALTLGRIAYVNRGSAPPEAPELRVEISTPGGSLTFFALSPDARSLVYQATVDGHTQLWLRPLDAETAQPLPGTDDATYPFWSPDSRSVAFSGSGQLRRIDLAGGLVQTVSATPAAYGGTWSRDGVILFSPTTTSPLYRVPASGGPAVAATRVAAPGETSHLFPSFLHDGRHYLVFVRGTTTESLGVYVGALDSTDRRRLVDAESAAVFSPPDCILFARGGALMAQRLDLATLNLIGDPWAVAGRLVRDPGTNAYHALSASSVGPVAYRATAEERQLIWLDRSGRQIGALGGPDAAQPGQIRLSPDGRAVVLARVVAGNRDVWLLDTARGMLRRFTTDPARDSSPTWSPDGSRVVFNSQRLGVDDLYEKPVAGEATETLLLASAEYKYAQDWSLDGRFILYRNVSAATTGNDVWALPLDGDRNPVPVAQTPFNESVGRFSPDGHWVANTSDDSGRTEIYIQPFPGPGAKTQISTNGGTYPAWRRDGRELFYLAKGQLMAAPITLSGSRVDVGRPAALFPVPLGASQYDVTADGQRFLFDTVVKEASPITILMNWKGPK